MELKVENTPAIIYGNEVQNQYHTFTEFMLECIQFFDEGQYIYIDSDNKALIRNYREIATEARKMLQHFHNLGMKNNDKIILYPCAFHDFVVSFWACIFGGIVPVVAPQITNFAEKNRNSDMLYYLWEMLDFTHICTNTAIVDQVSQILHQYSPRKISFVAIEEAQNITQQAEIFPAKPQDTALIIMTSGTTGKPKLIQHPHENMVYLLPPLNKNTSQLYWHPLHHIAGLRCAFPDRGRKLYLPTTHMIQDPNAWLEYISKYRITNVTISNFFLKHFLDNIDNTRNWDLNCLKRINLAGETAIATTIEQFLEKMQKYAVKKETIHSIYGMSEINIISGGKSFSPSKFKNVMVTNCGVAAPGLSVRIVDSNNKVLSDYQEGEIQVRGRGVTSGLHKQQSSKMFTEDGWLKTHDLGFIKNDELHVTGRIGDIVVINAENFYCTEIEEVVESIDGVQKAIACSFQKHHATEQLIIFFYSKTPQSPNQQIQRILSQKLSILPRYIIPINKEDIPITDSGKIQRSSLRTRFLAGEFDHLLQQSLPINSEAPVVTPYTKLQQKLCKIWKDTLQVEQIHIEDEFFALGGHSLLAIRLINEVRETLQIDLPLHSIFEAPTVKELAIYIENNCTKTKVIPKLNQNVYPLSSVQKQMWFLYQMQPQSSFYNMHTTKKLTGNLDTQVLKTAVQHIVARQSTLRTIIKPNRNENVQQHIIDQDIPLDIVSVANDEQLQQQIKKITQTPFALEEFPLVRFQLIQTTTNNYVFCVVVHHAISDYWSMQIIWNEICTAYNALVNNTQPQLPALDITYGDFCSWQQQQDMTHLREYWLQKCKDIPILDLPTDKPRPQQQSFAGEKYVTILPKSIEQKLYSLAKEQDCTLFMVLTAVFNILLGRYSHQHDITIGFPIANRHYASLEHNVGFFINNLMLCNDLRGNPTFNHFLQRVRKVTLEAYEHQGYPFEQLVEEINPQRDLSRNPIFQVLINMLEFEDQVSHSHLQDVEIVPFSREISTTRFDITLYIQQRDCLRFTWSYSTDLFTEQTIARMSTHFLQLLESVVENPQQKITRLNMLTSDEQKFLIAVNNTTHAFEDTVTTVHQLFDDQVQKTPHKIAVVCGERQISYAELQDRANQLAHFLQQQNTQVENVVAILVSRSIDMITAILAVGKVGAAYVFLDAKNPQSRLQAICQDANISLLLTESSMAEQVNLEDTKAIFIDAQPWTEQVVFTNVAIHPQNAMYLSYTSGSTGTPKGIVHTHEAVLNGRNSLQKNYPLSESDRVLQLTSLAFDPGVRDIFVPLTVGAKIVIIPHVQEIATIVHSVAKGKITVILSIVPSFLDFIVDNINENSLRLILCQGETLPAQLRDKIHAQFSHKVQLVNQYGVTENCFAATHCLVTQHHLSIGTPTQNTQVYILDPHLNKCPIGVPGEIYISGNNLARGYVKNNTAMRFVPNPFAAAGSRMYKTGDTGKYLSDGSIKLLGRIDAQIKILGTRIEPREINYNLEKYEDIRDSVVIFHEQLIAFYVSEKDIDEQLLRSHMRKYLPQIMIPKKFVRIEQIPLMMSGKVDLQALHNLKIEKHATISPLTHLEKQIADIWQDILQVNNITAHDDFFALGGHSLLAIRLINKVRKVLQIDLPLHSIFEAPTVKDLAIYIENNCTKTKVIPKLNLNVYPLSSVQKQMWFLYQMQPQSSFYNMYVVKKLTGNLDTQVFQTAIQHVVARQSTLRTVIKTDGDNNVQQYIIDQDIPLDIAFVNSDEQLQQQIKKITQTPFALEQFPLVRFQLIHTTTNNYVFCVVIHHVISDYWSMQVIWREICTAYNALANNTQPQLPALDVTYGDFCVWQQQQDMTPLREYWLQKCKDIPVLDLPTDKPRPQQQSFAGEKYVTALPKSIEQKLHSLAKEQDCTLFMVLTAAFNILLSRYSGQHDICVGFPIANRHYGPLEHNVGFFINNLVLRNDLRGNPTFHEFLQRVRKVTLEAYEHQGYPFEQLVEEINPQRDLSRNPIFQVLINMLEFEDQVAHSPLQHVTVAPFARETSTTRFDITLYIQQRDSLRFIWRYSTDLFSEQTIARMSTHFVQLLESVTTNPRTNIHYLAMMSKSELSPSIIHRDLAYKTQNIIDLVADSVIKFANKKAVVGHDNSCTYAQLQIWSDRLSAALQNSGVKRESHVVLVTDYSVDTLVAILGILKSGATCIPINPDFSTEKSQSLMETAHIVLHSKSIAPPTSSAMQIEQAFLYQGRTAQKPKIYPEQTAFIIYTSGSTGSANGVVISHKNVASKMQTIAKSLRINAQDTCILTASLSFIAAIRQIFVPLIHGASLVVPSKETLRDPLLLFAQMDNSKVTVVDFVPSYAKTCAQTLLNNSKSSLHSLRQIATSGEKLPAETVRLWRELIPSIRFVNIYGQTETTAGVTLYEVPQDISAQHNIPVGRGVGVNHLYVLDSYLQPVPQGAIGEIYIASDEIARGYLNRQHTATKFIANPFTSGIMYKTGDRARYNFHQQLEIIERSDAQIKIRGYRVDPQEIETTLCELPSIADAAIILYQGVLQAYINSNQQLKYQEIYQYLQTRLPEYMIPRKIFTISHLPTTDSGKIDYRLLQDLAEQQRFLFTPKWVHKHLSRKHHDAQYLFFGEKPQGKSNALCVIPGTEFDIDHEQITMNFTCENHYQQLVNYLRDIQFDFKNVIYAHHDVEHFAKFVQAFAMYLPQMHIAIICRNIFALRKDSTVNPKNALIVGASRALALEYPGLRHTCIDIRCQPLTADILCEFGHNFPERNVLYDNNQRYVMHYEPVIPQETTVRDDDVYVITGGLGNIGTHLALFLAKKAKVKIAITTRCIKNNAHKFTKLLDEVTKLGSELIVFETSLTNRDELSDTIIAIEKQLGKIRAVMHCAGSREQFSLLAQGAIITEETRFKIDSSTILIEVLQKNTTAFLMLFSSLSSLFGRYAQASYCAANAYIDTLAHSTDLRVMSVNWDVWKEQPLPLAANIPQDIVQLIHRDAYNGISNVQGTQAMLNLLNHPLRQAIVSTRSEITGYSIEELTTSLDSVAPTTSLQKQIAAIWCEALQLESVSIHDNFFHVGGHSLLAITVMEKIRLLANIESSDHQSLPLSILLTHPTIAQLASAINSLHSALQEQVIQMNSRVEDRPFIFLVHGPGVDPICYQHLAKSLDGIFTVYAMRSSELSHTTSLVDTAKYHIQKIKSVQKVGPYIVGGMCLGGLVAFEVAQQLSSMGDNVKLTFLMDLINIPGMENYKSQQLHKDRKRRQKKRLQKTMLFWRHVFSGDVNFVVHKIKKIIHGLSIKRKINKLTNSRIKLRKQMRAHMRTIRDEYRIQYYDGELIYIRSEKLQANYAEKRLRQLAKSVKVHKLSGTIHSDVTRPYFAEKTSEIIQSYLGISEESNT